MSTVNIKDNLFLILKTEDIDKGLEPDERLVLQAIIIKIQKYREKTGREAAPNYWVVNQDEEYSGMIIEQIIKGEALKN
ncbi:MAG: hypothetical protein HOG49_28710 [Candidatus Scalindua sp.]|jgi:hypothetical protein|nr:hypothetical protein [Candidatus Scalindua sp.]